MYENYNNNQESDSTHEEEVTQEQHDENDIGIVAVANAPYNIHCLTVIGQIVVIDSDYSYSVNGRELVTSCRWFVFCFCEIVQSSRIESLFVYHLNR